MTVEELVNKYILRLLRSDNKKNELDEIISNIDSLTYSESDTLISNETKEEILTKLREQLAKKIKSFNKSLYDSRKPLNEKTQRIVSSTDNKELLDLMSKIEIQLKGRK